MKKELFIFDLDGCIADSDNFIVTNEYAYSIDKSLIENESMLKDEAFCKAFNPAYLYTNQDKVKPYRGILDLFVKLSIATETAIVTSRYVKYADITKSWLSNTISRLYGKHILDKMHYRLFFNDNKEKSLVYKKRIFLDLQKSYDIKLVIDDHPEVSLMTKDLGINCLVPATGYKNLNGSDLIKEGKDND